MKLLNGSQNRKSMESVYWHSTMCNMQSSAQRSLKIHTDDGFALDACYYPAAEDANQNKNLIINSATAVDKKLYHHYATFMATQGYQVMTYDYRGIAGSRPQRLRGFNASFVDWGRSDFAAVLQHMTSQWPNNKNLVLGHSIGGTLIGMYAACQSIDGLISLGAQTAYYKDWAPGQKFKLYLLWHGLFPLVTALVGYFPGKKLRLLEDVPKGVIQQWHSRRKSADFKQQLNDSGFELFYQNYTGPLLTLGVEDDPIGTEAAITRLHTLFTNADKQLQMLSLAEADTDAIGHFGFFRRTFQQTLWLKTLNWFNRI